MITNYTVVINWIYIVITLAFLGGVFAMRWFIRTHISEYWETYTLFRDAGSQMEGWVDPRGDVMKSWLLNSKTSPKFAGRLPDHFQTRVHVQRTYRLIGGGYYTETFYDWNTINLAAKLTEDGSRPQEAQPEQPGTQPAMQPA